MYATVTPETHPAMHETRTSVSRLPLLSSAPATRHVPCVRSAWALATCACAQEPCRCARRAQAELRKEAAASAIEEQLKDKEATEADNAANLAKLAEHEALVRARDRVGLG